MKAGFPEADIGDDTGSGEESMGKRREIPGHVQRTKHGQVCWGIGSAMTICIC